MSGMRSELVDIPPEVGAGYIIFSSDVFDQVEIADGFGSYDEIADGDHGVFELLRAF